MHIGSTTTTGATADDPVARPAAFHAAQALRDAGVDVMFGLLGHANYVFGSYFVALGGRYIGVRHESSAVSMADAYARLTGRAGVATVTQGPGLTNTATALVEARKSRSSVLLIAGDTTPGTQDNQDIDQSAFGRACGVIISRPESSEEIPAAVLAALEGVVEDRRPRLISLDHRLQDELIEVPAVVARASEATRPGRASAVAVRAAAERIASSRRPVVIAGRGVTWSGAQDGLRLLLDRLGCPAATTAQAMGVLRDYPLSIGICGGYSRPAAWELLEEADLLIVVGASLSKYTTRRGALTEGVDIVHLDLEPRADSLGIAGDLAETLAQLRNDLEYLDVAPKGWAEVPERGIDCDESGPDGADPAALSVALDRLLPSSRLVVLDSGHYLGWPARHITIPDESAWYFPIDFQALGLGLAASIGAAVARPDKLAVCLIGDGGLQMALGELDTAVRTAVPLLVVVYDDAAYGAEFHLFNDRGYPPELSLFPRVDVPLLAASVGARGERAATISQAEDAISAWLKEPVGVFIVQVEISRRIRGSWMNEAQHVHLFQPVNE